jgi:hypothetical protein
MIAVIDVERIKQHRHPSHAEADCQQLRPREVFPKEQRRERRDP